MGYTAVQIVKTSGSFPIRYSYYILLYFVMMEQEELVTRAERVGILTTAKGSRKMIALMNEKYQQDIEAIIGQAIFSELRKRCEPT
jgi:hypothetical protein